MSERSRVQFGNSTIEYEVRRSERRKKTVRITVDGSGVLVAAPTITPDRELQAIVRKRAPWILSHLSDAVLRAAPNRLVSGEALPYLGPQRPSGYRASGRAVDREPLRPLAVPRRRADDIRGRPTLRTDSPGRRRVVQVPGRRAAAGRCRALVAQTGTGRKVTDTGPRPAPTLGKLRP